jgi:peroxiredoxin
MKSSVILILLCASSLLVVSQDKTDGLNIGERAPDFFTKDQFGMEINLKSELRKNSVVLVFYRGQWCPYCNKELKTLEDSLRFIRAKGAIVIAVTPENPENINKTIEKTKASYSVLYDEGLKIMKSYQVAFSVDSLTITKYKSYGIDFASVNGVNGANLPVPAVYVINRKGKIVYRHFDPDYRKRASINEIIKHL